MKALSILLLGLMSLSVSASQLEKNPLVQAINSSLVEAEVEMPAGTIFAWEAKLEDHEVLVEVMNTQFLTIAYGCHYHGPFMACHEEGHADHKSLNKEEAVDLEFVKNASHTALSKFERTVTRQGKDFGIVQSIKVWAEIEEDGHDDHDHGHAHKVKENDHDHGPNVWTKIQYNQGNDKTAVIYVLCHVHGGETEFACHYRKEAHEEPTL